VALFRKAGILEDEKGTHFQVLDALLNKKFGDAWLDMDRDALKLELVEAFGELGDNAWERIQALRLLHANEMPWEDWGVFDNVVAAIVGSTAVFSYVQKPEPEDLVIAVYAMKAVREVPFSDEVLRYMAAACIDDTVWYVESPLEAVQPHIREHFSEKNIELPYESVADALAAGESPTDPGSVVDFQVHEVLAVRKVRDAYIRSVNQQMKQAVQLGIR